MDFLNCKPKHLHTFFLPTPDSTISRHNWVASLKVVRPHIEGLKVKMLSDDQKRLVLRLRDEAGLTLQNGLQAKL
ncbi:hypothetical protein [Pseudanabaena phage PA-SR01]|nr:hypothetical protein [Pseudanabaena phage PA-SR01]